ncbi:hypothetical protein [Massilia soli]|nr:hypothetical protein [Massilia soli]
MHEDKPLRELPSSGDARQAGLVGNRAKTVRGIIPFFARNALAQGKSW